MATDAELTSASSPENRSRFPARLFIESMSRTLPRIICHLVDNPDAPNWLTQSTLRQSRPGKLLSG